MLSFEDVPPISEARDGTIGEIVGGIISDGNYTIYTSSTAPVVAFKAEDYGYKSLRVKVRSGSAQHARFFILTPDNQVILYSTYWHQFLHDKNFNEAILARQMSIEEILELPYVYLGTTENDIGYWINKHKREQQKGM